jgi:hypothetical protein
MWKKGEKGSEKDRNTEETKTRIRAKPYRGTQQRSRKTKLMQG